MSGKISAGAAHPRSRGEHAKNTAQSIRYRGSSPLTRGARHPGRERLPDERLIPAHAGSTTKRVLKRPLLTAHPRSRGEHLLELGECTYAEGSSPLTRGALHSTINLFRYRRLIPAHAGSTVMMKEMGMMSPAHPRSRGEHCQRGIDKVPRLGSSPLTRGALDFHSH